MKPQVVGQPLRLTAHHLINQPARPVDAKGGGVAHTRRRLRHALHLRHAVGVLRKLQQGRMVEEVEEVEEGGLVTTSRGGAVLSTMHSDLNSKLAVHPLFAHASARVDELHAMVRTRLVSCSSCGNISWHFAHQAVPYSTTAVPGRLEVRNCARP